MELHRRSNKKYAKQAIVAYHGGPKFFAAANNGWVHDWDVAGTQKLLQTSGKAADVLGMSKAAKARALKQVEEWETKELRRSYPDPAASVKAARAANVWLHQADKALKGAVPSAKKAARTQQLWNAAHNDEITLSSIGHAHPSEPSRFVRMAPEFNNPKYRRSAHITTATDMDYEPLKWLHEQGEPGSPVVSRHAKAAPVALAAHARTQQLWNAAHNDDIHSGEGPSKPEPGYHPRQWLAAQQDRTEMGSRYAHQRMFESDDHSYRNRGGAFESDESLGIKVDKFKGNTQMLGEEAVADGTATAEEPSAAAAENATVTAELDDLRNLAMSAYDDLPEGVNPAVRAICQGDYDTLVGYLDQVAADATQIPHGNATPNPAGLQSDAAAAAAAAAPAAEGDAAAGDAAAGDAAAAGAPTALKSLKELPRMEVVLALRDAVRAPLIGEKRWQSQHPDAPEEVTTQKVMAALSVAKDLAAQILMDPSTARLAATAELEQESRWQQLSQRQLVQAERFAQLRQAEAEGRFLPAPEIVVV